MVSHCHAWKEKSTCGGHTNGNWYGRKLWSANTPMMELPESKAGERLTMNMRLMISARKRMIHGLLKSKNTITKRKESQRQICIYWSWWCFSSAIGEIGYREGKGFGGFPVGGQWLKCINPE